MSVRVGIIRLIITIFFILPTSFALADKFVVGVEWVDYSPIYSTSDNRYKGFSRDLLDEFAKVYNHKFEYRPLSVHRLNLDYLDGQFDFKFPDNVLWNSKEKKGKNIVYSDSVLEYIDGVMVLSENHGKGREKLKTLGYLYGFTPWNYQDEINSGKLETRKTGTIKHLFKMLKTKRVDGIYMNITVGKYHLNHSENNENLALFDIGLPHTVSEYRLSSFKHPEIVAQFNTFLEQKRDVVSKLKQKYKL